MDLEQFLNWECFRCGFCTQNLGCRRWDGEKLLKISDGI